MHGFVDPEGDGSGANLLPNFSSRYGDAESRWLLSLLPPSGIDARTEEAIDRFDSVLLPNGIWKQYPEASRQALACRFVILFDPNWAPRFASSTRLAEERVRSITEELARPGRRAWRILAQDGVHDLVRAQILGDQERRGLLVGSIRDGDASRKLEERMALYLEPGFPVDIVAEMEELPRTLQTENIPLLLLGHAATRALLLCAAHEPLERVLADLPRFGPSGLHRLFLPYAHFYGAEDGNPFIDGLFDGARFEDVVTEIGGFLQAGADEGGSWRAEKLAPAMRDSIEAWRDALPPVHWPEVSAGWIYDYLASVLRRMVGAAQREAVRAFLPLPHRSPAAQLIKELEYREADTDCGDARARFLDTAVAAAREVGIGNLFTEEEARTDGEAKPAALQVQLLFRIGEGLAAEEEGLVLRFGELWCGVAVRLQPDDVETATMEDAIAAFPGLRRAFAFKVHVPGFEAKFLAIPSRHAAWSAISQHWVACFMSARTLEPSRRQTTQPAEAVVARRWPPGKIIPDATRALLLCGSIDLSEDVQEVIRGVLSGEQALHAEPAPFLLTLLTAAGTKSDEMVSAALSRLAEPDRTDILILRYCRGGTLFEPEGFAKWLEPQGPFDLVDPQRWEDWEVRSGPIWFRLFLKVVEAADGKPSRAVSDSLRSLARLPEGDANQRELGAFVSLCVGCFLVVDDPGDQRLQILLLIYGWLRDAWESAAAVAPEQSAQMVSRCLKYLGWIRSAVRDGHRVDDAELFAECALRAARYLARHGSAWRGLKPLLLAFRALRVPALAPDLRAAAEEMSLGACLADAVDEFLRRVTEEDQGRELRQEMARDLVEFLKPVPAKDRGDPADRLRGFTQAEQAQDGFDIGRREPSAVWRYAYARALADLGVDVDGKGRFFRSVLTKVAQEDPSDDVRAAARSTIGRLEALHHGWAGGSSRRHLFQAWWWIRQAHMISMGREIDEKEAQKTRVTEYR